MYGAVALNSGSGGGGGGLTTSLSLGAMAIARDPEVVAKKAARVRRESFKPRPSVDPGDVWSSSSSMGSSADKRYAGMLGGVMAEDDG